MTVKNKKESPFKIRLLEFLKYVNMGQTAFEKETGLSKGSISRIVDEMHGKSLDKIAAKFPKLNIEWLRKGEIAGPMITEEQEALPNYQINPFLKRKHEGNEPVKYYDVDFAGGNGIVFYEDNVEFPAYEMKIPAFSGCVAFNVFGESMEPLIKSGSVCFGRKLDDWHDYIEFGQIYGVVMKNQRRFLKYIRKSQTPDKFLLKSANPEHDDFEIPINKIHNIWLIEGWMLKRT